MQEVIRIDLNGVNCYLGKQDGNFILFDTGGHMLLDKQFDNRYNALLEQLKTRGCTSENLKLIILTHGDNDHAANASALRKHFGAKIAIHEGDRALVEKPDIEMVMNTFRYRSLLLKVIMVFMKNTIRKIMIKILNEYEWFTPDIFLLDGDSLKKYGFDAQVLHLPGHTRGSIGILASTGDFIAGDLFMVNKKPEPAMLAYDFALLKESIDRVKKADIKTVLPGHGNSFDIKNFK